MTPLSVLALTVIALPAGSASATGTASISGVVTDVSHAPVAGVVVSADGSFGAQQVTTGADGTYTITGLSADTYYVCFDTTNASGASATGYESSCWQNVPLPPTGICQCDETPVPVTTGQAVTGISPTLQAGGAIAGTVSDAQGNPLAGAPVYADMGPGSPPSLVARTVTAADGTYHLLGLFPSTQYTVCVGGFAATGGYSTTGYIDECFGSVQAQGTWPAGTPDFFAVTAATTHAGTDITLPAAGRISGVVDDPTGKPLAGVTVTAEATDGSAIATASTDANGAYTVSFSYNGSGSNGEFSGPRLPVVPFDVYFHPPAGSGYLDQFYNDVLVMAGYGQGQPNDVTPTGGTVTTVSQRLSPSGSLSGVVTSDNQPLAGVRVAVTPTNSYPVYATTAADGTYTAAGLVPGTYTVCFSTYGISGGPSHAGYLDQCYAGKQPGMTPTPITLTLGQQVAGIDASIAMAAEIGGTVTNAAGAGVRPTVDIVQNGQEVAHLYGNYDGTYNSGPMTPGTYQVCFSQQGQYPSGNYLPQCFDDIAAGGGPTPLVATAGNIAIANATLHLPPSVPGALLPTSPVRVLDTRSGVGGSRRVPAHSAIRIGVAGGSAPAGAEAVVLNVQALDPAASGYLTAYADGSALPTTSDVNFAAGQNASARVVVPLGADGKIVFYNGSAGSVDIVADLAGAYLGGGTPTAPGAFVPVIPSRLMDTRTGLGSTAPSGLGTISLPVLGHGGVPATGVAAVVLNVTTTGAGRAGYVTAFTDGSPRPATSNVNFVPGQAASNLVVVPVGADGKIAFYNGSGSSVQVIADVAGYVLAGQASTTGTFHGLAATRILDTRSSFGGRTPPAGGTVNLHVSGVGGIPADVTAVVLNVTAVTAAGAGFVTAYAAGLNPPDSPVLVVSTGRTLAGLVVVPVGRGGDITLGNGTSADLALLADVEGYVVDG